MYPDRWAGIEGDLGGDCMIRTVFVQVKSRDEWKKKIEKLLPSRGIGTMQIN